MNKTVTEQHAIYKEKIKTEKSLKAVKRKLSDEVFKQDDFGLDTLRFKKSYCQEVKERKDTKKEDKPVLEVIKSEVSIQDILTKDKATISQSERYVTWYNLNYFVKDIFQKLFLKNLIVNSFIS